MLVQRRELYGSVQCGRGRPSYEKGSVKPSARHFPAEFFHLEKGRGYKSAYGDYVGLFPFRRLENGLAVHHDTQVNDVESVAGQHDAGDVLAYVVYIALDCGKYNFGTGCVSLRRPVSV